MGSAYHGDKHLHKTHNEYAAQLMEKLAGVVPSAAEVMTAFDTNGGDDMPRIHEFTEDMPLEARLLHQEEELRAGRPLKAVKVAACSHDEAMALCAAACSLFPVGGWMVLTKMVVQNDLRVSSPSVWERRGGRGGWGYLTCSC